MDTRPSLIAMYFVDKSRTIGLGLYNDASLNFAPNQNILLLKTEVPSRGED